MKQHLCRLAEKAFLWADVPLLVFDAPELAQVMQAGQFALVRDPSTFDPYLPHAAWFYRSRGTRLEVVAPPGDTIAERAFPGQMLDLLAPVGQTPEYADRAHHVVFIGEGRHIAPLVAMAHAAVTRGREVVLVSVSEAREGLLPPHLLPPEIEYRALAGPPGANELGSDLASWADMILATGSVELYRALGHTLRAARYRLPAGLAHVLIDLPMPCGVGTCYACVVETAHGLRLACTDGPWFDLSELVL